MSEDSKIEWTDHTFNPWWGCAKVSPGCDHCYAERDAARHQPGRALWGLDADRRTFGEKHWNEPLRWDRRAYANRRRERVFCASMADVFDNRAPVEERERLWKLIASTPNLDWLILTKRIGNARRMLPQGFTFQNVWLGASIVNQEEAERDIPKLLATDAVVRFLSCEPLLGPVDLRPEWLVPERGPGEENFAQRGSGAVDWVIVGGESGPSARPMHPAWARDIRDRCFEFAVPFLFKQWGEWASVSEVAGAGAHHVFDDGATVRRVGKRNAGRTLDGRVHDELPA